MEYTKPLLPQHRKHYSQEVFQVAPLEPEVDIFLPFWWIVKNTPHKVHGTPKNSGSAAQAAWRNALSSTPRNFPYLWTKQ